MLFTYMCNFSLFDNSLKFKFISITSHSPRSFTPFYSGIFLCFSILFIHYHFTIYYFIILVWNIQSFFSFYFQIVLLFSHAKGEDFNKLGFDEVFCFWRNGRHMQATSFFHRLARADFDSQRY